MKSLNLDQMKEMDKKDDAKAFDILVWIQGWIILITNLEMQKLFSRGGIVT
jgi:hypothetical protein